MKKKWFWSVIPVVILGAFLLLRLSPKMDRVDKQFADSSQLNEAALSWIPFEKQILGEAKSISMSTDVDTNQYVIHWKYLEPDTMKAFENGISKISILSEPIDCSLKRRPECEAMSKNGGTVLRHEIPQKGTFGKSFWLLDQDALRVVGSTQVPLPSHLK